MGIVTATDLQELFSGVLGFDLERHNLHLEEKNSNLKILIEDRERQLKRLDEELKRVKQKTDKVREWLVNHQLATDVFDDIPF